MCEKRDEQPLFSIVMPCYGVEAYIERALSCVCAQTYENWELIVVDDCSPDASAQIAARYAERDKRVRVVHHDKNKGLSAARNTGIELARGEYLWLPDPDDTYDADLLQNASDAISRAAGASNPDDSSAADPLDDRSAAGDSCNAPGPDLLQIADDSQKSSTAKKLDAIMFGSVEEYFDAEGKFLYDHPIPLEAGCYLVADEWHPLIAGYEQISNYGSACYKMYRLERIRSLSLRFENVRLIEDFLFNVAYFQGAESVCVLAGTPYHYAKRRGKSLTNANAFSAEEYYALHRRRVATMRDQLVSWGVLDDAAKATLGAQYGRFILSTLERQCYASEGLSRTCRRAWCEDVFRDELFLELLPFARAESSRSLKVCLRVLNSHNTEMCLALGRVMHFVQTRLYTVFTRARSGR